MPRSYQSVATVQSGGRNIVAFGAYPTFSFTVGIVDGPSVDKPALDAGTGDAARSDGRYTSVSTRADGSMTSSPHHFGIQK